MLVGADVLMGIAPYLSRFDLAEKSSAVVDKKIAKEDIASWNPTHLSGTTVTDKHKLEGRGLLLSHIDGCDCGVVATGTEDGM